MEGGGRITIPKNKCSWRSFVAILILFHLSILLWLGFSRHWSYQTSINDLAVFDQAVWGILNGAPFLNTSIFPDTPSNWLGLHFHFVLLIFVPIYKIFPTAEWFAIAQAFALSSAAWPIFLTVSSISESEKSGVLWTFAYLTNPFLLNAAAWDFHPVVLAVPLIAIGCYGVQRNNARMLIVSCMLLLFVKEEMGVSVAGFGLLWWLRYGISWVGGSLLIAGLSHTVLVLGVIMPALSPTQEHMMLSSGLGQLSRYSWLGNSLKEVFYSLLLRPFWVFRTVFFDFGGTIYLISMIAPFLCIPLLSLSWLLPGFADMAANFLSANPMPRGWCAYHSVTLIPLLTIAAASGCKKIAQILRRDIFFELAVVVTAFSALLGYTCAPLSLPGSANYWMPAGRFWSPDPSLERVKKIIHRNASISAQANIGAHFSQRREIYRFPDKIDKVDYIILHLESPTTRLHPDQPYYIGTLAHHLQMNPTVYLAKVKGLIADRQYKVIFWDDPWLVFAQDNCRSTISAAIAVQEKLVELCHLWTSP